MSTGSFFKTILEPISKAIDWITADDEKLRRARSRAMDMGEPVMKENDKGADEDKKDTTGRADEDEKDGTERFVDEYNVWEEIDSYRTTFWFGSRMGKYLSRAHIKDKKLEQELSELERKRKGEEMKGEED